MVSVTFAKQMQDTEPYLLLRKFPHALSQSIPVPTSPREATYLPVLDFYINGIIPYVFFCVRLLSLSIMYFRFIQIACTSSSFLFIAE